MDVSQMLAGLKSTKLYYDAALRECQSQSQSILLTVRKRCGWTQEEMGERLDCTASYISKVENSHYPISRPMLFVLAEIVEELEEIDYDIAQG